MPPGRLEMSLRSSASSAATEILVASAIWRSVTPRSSRRRFILFPKSGLDASTVATLRLMLGNARRGVKREDCALDDRLQLVDAALREETHGRKPRGARRRDSAEALQI